MSRLKIRFNPFTRKYELLQLIGFKDLIILAEFKTYGEAEKAVFSRIRYLAVL